MVSARVAFLALITLFPVLAKPMSDKPQAYLAQQALQDVLERAIPIAGVDDCPKHSKTCDWMAQVPDSTKLIHMNLPGTHDTATWNYTDARQAELLRYTGPIRPARVFRCQQHSLLQSLNEGIRVFDLRFAYNPGNDTIGFWHSSALLAPTTRMEDVFFALYAWLDKHPTETILASVKYEGGTGTPENEALYVQLYKIIHSAVGQRYWLQTYGKLGTLGEARGKLVLLQRFDYHLLPASLTKRIGIPLEPAVWTDNGQNIELVYNTAENQVAYIEDFYALGSTIPTGSTADAYISKKFEIVTDHLKNATTLHPDQLFITFASAASVANTEINPVVYALGDGNGTQGINHRLLSWFKSQKKGSRYGIILLDFYDGVPGLVEAIIGI